MPERCIRVRGARQNCLHNIDLDIPHRALTVVTGLSGSGKSSLAFDTLYAEGQRRYVETFSPYTRQFLERMDKPDVDSVENIPPAIAIEQRNAVRTSRSTVGTMTEINDYLKLLYARRAGIVTADGREIRPWTGEAITADLLERLAGRDVIIAFDPGFDGAPTLGSALAALKQQGYLRALVGGTPLRTDEDVPAKQKAPKDLLVIQDRVRVDTAQRARLSEAVEGAVRAGKGTVYVLETAAAEGKAKPAEHRYATDWRDPHTGETFRPPSPNLFSYNNPVGACPTCRGFGRTIDIDYERALPDRNLTIAEGVVRPWQSGVSAECQADLLKHCKKRRIPTDVPFKDLPAATQRFVIDGDREPGLSAEEQWEQGRWYGVRGYFDWLETKTYKMHVRVLLSRYRAYRKCPDCHGRRFQPQTLLYTLAAEGFPQRLTIADIGALSLKEAHDFLAAVPVPAHDEATRQLRHEAVLRLRYLVEVGLGYLTLDRTTRTLSGGEVQRVNLTSCLGNALVNTLFVLDEPTIGLHPRDTEQLLGVMTRLRDRGNTLVIVEHDEDVMRRADHIVDLGPGRGENGGKVVFAGPCAKLEKCKGSLTGAYLAGRRAIDVPASRRATNPKKTLQFLGASANNIRGLDITLPLERFVAVTGVSGSGKSTLVHDIVHRHLRRAHHLADEADGDSDPGELKMLKGAQLVGEIACVDQSPLTRTPRSNPALYLGIYEPIRRLFAATDDAVSQGLTASDFSFNAGNGRCTRCGGTGYEKIEMQFLADVFVTCPQCEGHRFQSHVLAIDYRGWNIDRLLHATADEARAFFAQDLPDAPADEVKRRAEIVAGLQALDDVGLGYLRLGQPLNQLSGGEAQRIKLLGYLHGRGKSSPKPKGKDADAKDDKRTRLIILDEPTTGLHFEDIRLLLAVLQRLVEQGDSLLVIEHNMDVVKCADWVLDLGPEAGAGGGELVAEGTPEAIAAHKTSRTARHLTAALEGVRSRAKAPTRRLPKTAAHDRIEIRGARHHNLKDLSLDVALNKTTVVTGLSGSGKSTLAFDLLFAEGQRRYLDSLNAYARQFVEQLEKPQVDSITGIPPAVAIEQRLSQGGRKSTVATVTEIYQFLRLLYAKLGVPHDPDTGEAAVQQTAQEVFRRLETQRKRGELAILAPLVRGRKGFHTDVAKWAEKKGFPFLRADGKWIEPAKFTKLDRYREHTIEAVLGNIDNAMKPADRRRLVDLALTLGKGTLYAIDARGKESVYSTQLYCPGSGRSFDALEPRLFSYNSPHGWCPECQGYGTVLRGNVEGDTEAEREAARALAYEYQDGDDAAPCPACHGARLNAEARSVRLPLGSRLGSPTITELGALSIEQAQELFARIKFTGRETAVARDILPEISQRLRFLREVGLGYLTLDRSATTLSGGEAQRIRLAAQIGSNLQGVLYVLDEPTIGLHPRDNERLLATLAELKAKGNTLVVVEHDEDTMRAADDIIDLGPGAGIHGGTVVARGPWKKLAKSKESVTGRLLGEPLSHPLRGERRPVTRATPKIAVKGARAHNLKRVNVDLPQGRLIVLCGVSGAGKSTLMHDILKPALTPKRGRKPSGPWTSVTARDALAAVYEVDQAPIGKTSRSTPATYTGLMDDIRALFAQLPLARQRGYTKARFSFNSGHGRCEACQGQGALKVEMNFLPPTWIPCDACEGRRYKPETLEVLYEGRSIADVLDMTIDEAADFFAAVPRLVRPLELLRDTGLGYLSLGQRSPTLSGGEAQRIKLVAELARSVGVNAGKKLELRHLAKRQHLYLLEEPTIGLHLADVRRLLDVLHALVDVGHTVVVIEHHLDVIAEADWVVEMGPEGGEDGGRVIAQGTPEVIAGTKGSLTAPFLQPVLKAARPKTLRKKTSKLTKY